MTAFYTLDLRYYLCQNIVNKVGFDKRLELMKILYAEDNDNLRDIIAMAIEAELAHEVIEVSSGNSAIHYLKENHDINLVISDYNMPDGNGGKLYEYVKANCQHIPFILVSSIDLAEDKIFESFYQDHPQNAYFLKSGDFTQLHQIITKSLVQFPREEIYSSYMPVKIFRFIKFNCVNCPIFLKLSETKFIKIINKNELYDLEVIEKFSSKGVGNFYIEKVNYLAFSDYYSKTIQSKLESLGPDEKSSDDHISTELAGISFIHESILNLGIDGNVIKTMDAVVKSIITRLKTKTNLYNLLENMIKNASYLYEHSMLISYISSAICLKMEWNTNNTLEKLAYASLLHDVCFEDPTLAMLHDLEEIKQAGLNRKDVEKIKNHPLKIAEMIQNAKNFPPDIDFIISSHHEKPDGSGFPKGIGSSQISPLTCVFIIAEDFVHQIYSKEIKQKIIEDILDSMKDKYNKGNFRRPLDGLNKLFNFTK